MSVDGEPVGRSVLSRALKDAGFVPSGPGMRINPGYAEAAEERAEAAEDETELEEGEDNTEAGG